MNKIHDPSIQNYIPIYQMEEEYRKVLEELEENGGEITPEIEIILSTIEENSSIALERYFNIHSELEASADKQKELGQTILKKAAARYNTANSIKSRIANIVMKFGESASTPKGLPKYVFNTPIAKFALSPSEFVDVHEWDLKEYKTNNFIQPFIKTKVEVTGLDVQNSLKLQSNLEKTGIEYKDSVSFDKALFKKKYSTFTDEQRSNIMSKVDYNLNLSIK
jgi:hypothetical protein